MSSSFFGSGSSAADVVASGASTNEAAKGSSSRPSLATSPRMGESTGAMGACGCATARARWSMTSCTVVCGPRRLRGSPPAVGNALWMSPSSSTVISESNPRSPASVCEGLIASCGKALMRATEARIVFATRSSRAATLDGGNGTGAGAGTGLGARPDGGMTGMGRSGGAIASCGTAIPLPASAAACCSSTFACCCNSATCSRNSATKGSICVISCAPDGSRNGSDGIRGRSTGQ